MKMKIALSTAALLVLPTLTMAAGCNHDNQAMSCAEGTVYASASASHSCIVTIT